MREKAAALSFEVALRLSLSLRIQLDAHEGELAKIQISCEKGITAICLAVSSWKL